MRYVALLVLLVGCEGPLTASETFRAEYALTSESGNCPPYAPERLQVGPQVLGDRTCLWAPLEGERGLNLLCGFAAPTATKLLSWDAVAMAGELQIDFAPTCSGRYSVRALPAGQ